MSNGTHLSDLEVVELSNTKRKYPPEEDSSDENSEVVNVDFEWFDPQEIDFHGIKLLLRQLFDVDSDLFDISALSELIISQAHLGSTVKVTDDDLETRETDPFAFLTVLNLQLYQTRPEIKTLVNYLASKCSSTSSLSVIADVLEPSAGSQVGLVLCERFINMPPQIAPPMYKMLQEETHRVMEENKQYKLSHYLILSKTYIEIPSKMESDPESGPRRKKKKGINQPRSEETFYFHAEDEAFEKCALAHGNFNYTKKGTDGASDAKRAFQEAGIEPTGHLILIAAESFEGAVNAVDEYVNSGSS